MNFSHHMFSKSSFLIPWLGSNKTFKGKLWNMNVKKKKFCVNLMYFMQFAYTCCIRIFLRISTHSFSRVVALIFCALSPASKPLYINPQLFRSNTMQRKHWIMCAETALEILWTMKKPKIGSDAKKLSGEDIKLQID